MIEHIKSKFKFCSNSSQLITNILLFLNCLFFLLFKREAKHMKTVCIFITITEPFADIFTKSSLISK